MRQGKPRILIALLMDHEFQRMQADDALAAADLRGFEPEVVFADNSAVLQIQQLYKAIHRPAEERVKAIVVQTVVGEGLERVARSAAQAGVGWILINRRVPYLEDLRRRYPGLPIATVGADQIEIGRIQARQFRILAADRGVVLYVQGPPDTSAARERLAGVQQGLAGTSIELRGLDGDWTEKSGERAVERWLRLKTSEGIHPVLVGCQNDTMAVGAKRALSGFNTRPELAQLPLTGCDGLPAGGRRLVDLRQLAATVITPSNTGPAIDLLARSFKTNQPLPAELLLKPSSYPDIEELERRRAPRR
jgi:ABC-type sugar transport system substrate-binding protein